LKVGNVTFNDIKVNSKCKSESNSKAVYDQTVQQVNDYKVNSFEFDVGEEAVSIQEMRV